MDVHDLQNLQKDILEIKLQLEDIQKTLKLLVSTSSKLNNHIDFVEETYDSLKTPLNFVKDTVKRLTLQSPQNTDLTQTNKKY